MSQKRALTPDEERAILDQYKAGVKPMLIRKQLGIGSTVLYRVLRENGIHLRGGGAIARVRWDIDTVRQAWAMYQAGQSAEQIGRRFGVSRYTAARELRNAGHRLSCGPASARAQAAAALTEQIADLYRAGSTIRQIAEIVGRRDSTVSNILKLAGVPLRGTNVDPIWQDDDSDADPAPPRWAVIAYLRRVAGGMPEPTALKVSHLAHYDHAILSAALQHAKIPL